MAERIDDAPRFASYEEFWPYYVAMHSRAVTRRIHAVGTLAGAALAVHGLATGRPRRLLALPVLGYSAAWPAHWLVERNDPASFGFPLWSFRGDVEMIRYQLTGRDGELDELARTWLADHPEDRSPGSTVAPAEDLPAAA
jgi:hypothetical protein